MTAQPKTKIDELLERIRALDASRDRNEFVLRQLQRDIESVASQHRAWGYELFGMLAALNEDVEETRRCFEAARRLEPRATEILLNYGAALARFGYFSEVRALLHEAHALVPSDLVVLERLIGATGACCRFTDAVSLLGKREKLSNASPAAYASEIREIQRFLADAGVSDDEGEGIMTFASDALQTARVFDVRTHNRFAADEESRWLNVNIWVRRPVEIAVDLNESLAEREAQSQFSHAALLNICVIFISTRNYADHAG